ncbi:hypothetical protein ACTXT7_017214, partial [Hymenolepis weldensis]
MAEACINSEVTCLSCKTGLLDILPSSSKEIMVKFRLDSFGADAAKTCTWLNLSIPLGRLLHIPPCLLAKRSVARRTFQNDPERMKKSTSIFIICKYYVAPAHADS